MGIASLVLGIVSLIFTFIPGINFLGIVLSIVGIILGALGRKNEETRGVATGGLVCSIIALVLSLIWVLACGALVGTTFLAGLVG